MRFANPAEATGGSVGQRLGDLRICKGCLGSLGCHGRPWGSLGVHGGPWGRLGAPVRVLVGPQGVLGCSLGASLKVLGGS